MHRHGEQLARDLTVRALRSRIDDRFAGCGPCDKILDAYGLAVGHVVEASRTAVKAKTAAKRM